MKMIKELPDVETLRKMYPISAEIKKDRENGLQELRDIMEGESKKKLLIIGPCSADREDAVLEYAERLRKVADEVAEKLVVVLRVYTGKPRTDGKGYKGLLHRPETPEGTDNITSGIVAMREIHHKVLSNTGLLTSDEMLYPEVFRYVEDLLAYMAVGARSVEDQQHRMLASGLDIPVGMKNPTGGSIDVMLNAVAAAQVGQHLIYSNWEAETEGNPYAHAIVRGYVDRSGKNRPNYHYEDLCELYDSYIKQRLKNPSVIVDCNHSNSGKRFEEQIRIACEVMDSCKCNSALNRFVKGLMIESYLEDGNQIIGGGVYGKSVTDPCLGWEKTSRLICELSSLV